LDVSRNVQVAGTGKGITIVEIGNSDSIVIQHRVDFFNQQISCPWVESRGDEEIFAMLNEFGNGREGVHDLVISNDEIYQNFFWFVNL